MTPVARFFPRLARWAWIPALAALLSCLGPEDPGPVRISLDLEADSLSGFSSVLVVLLDPRAPGDTLDTLWNGPVASDTRLDRVLVKGYRGGDVVILLIGSEGKAPARVLIIRYDRRTGQSRWDNAWVPDWPDTAAPELTLLGPSRMFLGVGEEFTDPGATCLDDKDGPVVVQTIGAVDAGRMGVYSLKYYCRDKAGRYAQDVFRTVEVVQDPPPAISLRGADSLALDSGAVFADPGADCVDRREGARPLETAGSVDARKPGRYVLSYSCRDAAGNAAIAIERVVRVRRILIGAAKETIMDTTKRNDLYNNGFTPVVTFGKRQPADPWATVLAFDADQADKPALRSAEATFLTYVSGFYLPFDSLKIVFRIHRVMQPWVEGTGCWYFHGGAYHNDGEVFLRNHSPSPEIWAAATDPFFSEGLTWADRSILGASNLVEAGADTLVLSYRKESFSQGGPGVAPSLENLIPITLDLTRYVRETPRGKAHGLVITTEGVPTGIWINWATKELGDGTLGPALRFRY